MTRGADRRRQDRGLDLEAVRATTEELRRLMGPYREEHERMAALLKKLSDDLFDLTRDDAE